MGRAPCCDKANVKKGPWSPEEDAKLKSYIEQNGTGGNWIALPHKIGLKRCGKSCRLRWLNYLRPNIKHGGFSEEEDNIICSLYISIGSRWSIIAAQLPGRTDNDIKNYWNTRLKKKLLGKQRKEQSKRCVMKPEMLMNNFIVNDNNINNNNHGLIINQTTPYWPHQDLPLYTPQLLDPFVSQPELHTQFNNMGSVQSTNNSLLIDHNHHHHQEQQQIELVYDQQIETGLESLYSSSIESGSWDDISSLVYQISDYESCFFSGNQQ